MKNICIALSDNRSSLFIQHCPNLCMSVFSLFRDSCLHRPPSLTDHFGLSNNRKLTLSTFQVSSVTRKLIIIASHLNRFPCAFDYNGKVLRKLVVVVIRIVEGSVVVEGVLPVDIAGSCEVELFSVHEVQVLLGLITCEGCLVVRSGHGPQAEVAQGVGPGPLVEL